MKKRFKKGQHVRHRTNGRVMEVLKYIKKKSSLVVECAWFDLEKKEIRKHYFDQSCLLKAV